MRTLNTNVKYRKQNSIFSLPGFRSGSIVKKFFALLYYCFAAVSYVKWFISWIGGDFSGAGDIFGFILLALMILGVFLTPVIVIGVSDHYDWHGIKLFLIVMISVCALSTVALFSTSLFSNEYYESVTGPVEENVTDGIEDSSLSSGSGLDLE